MNAKPVGDGRDVGEEIENADATAVSTDTASAPWLKPYRWKAGQSGNPGGRLGGLARRVRELTANGGDIVEFLYRVMIDPNERTRDRLPAAHELLNRGWGKAPAFLAIHLAERQPPKPKWDLSRLSIEETRELLRLFDKLFGKSTLPVMGKE